MKEHIIIIMLKHFRSYTYHHFDILLHLRVLLALHYNRRNIIQERVAEVVGCVERRCDLFQIKVGKKHKQGKNLATKRKN